MLFFREIWTLGDGVKKGVEHFKHCLIGHTSKSIEDSYAKCYLNCGVMVQKITEEKNINMLARDCSCNILVKDGWIALLSEESAWG